MTNSAASYTLILGLICGFAQAAPGQQSNAVQPAPATMIGGSQGSTGGASESDVATANNLKSGEGVEQIASFIIQNGGLTKAAA